MRVKLQRVRSFRDEYDEDKDEYTPITRDQGDDFFKIWSERTYENAWPESDYVSICSRWSQHLGFYDLIPSEAVMTDNDGGDFVSPMVEFELLFRPIRTNPGSGETFLPLGDEPPAGIENREPAPKPEPVNTMGEEV